MSDIETMDVPTEALYDHVIAIAHETAEWESTIDMGRDANPISWYLTEVEIEEHEILDEQRIRFWGTVEGQWTEKTRSSTWLQPAEYAEHSAMVGVEIILDLDDLGHADVTPQVLDY